jgi:hypothetical protein
MSKISKSSAIYKCILLGNLYGWFILSHQAHLTLSSANICFKNTYECLHLEWQHQLNLLLQKYEHLFYGILVEFNTQRIPISLQLMDPDYKPFMRVNTRFLNQRSRNTNKTRKSQDLCTLESLKKTKTFLLNGYPQHLQLFCKTEQ